MADKRELKEAFCFFLNGELERMIFSNPRPVMFIIRLLCVPLCLRGTEISGGRVYGKTAVSKNMDRKKHFLICLSSLTVTGMGRLSQAGSMNVLVGKKGDGHCAKKLKIAPAEGKGAAL